MEVAVLHDGEDKFANRPQVILADSSKVLLEKVGTFLLDRMTDDDIGCILKEQNGEHEPSPESFPDTEAGERAYEAAHEAWENYEPSNEAIATFREHTDKAEVLDLYRETVCRDTDPWQHWHVHTTMDDDAYSSVTVVA